MMRALCVERMRPALGTFVRVRVEGLDRSSADRAIDAAFAAVSQVHALMSAHEPDSDLSRLNRAEPGEWAPLDPRTRAVLGEALRLARLTEGVFDPAIGAACAAAGVIPAPGPITAAHPAADWRDLELREGGARKRRPLWLDLGGIAKGYAVDLAVEALRACGVSRGAVDAGGDLRVFGDAAQTVALHAGDDPAETLMSLTLGEAAVASSGPMSNRSAASLHLDGRDGSPVRVDRFASVVAPDCMRADALTKVVLALGDGADGVLRAEGASGVYRDGATPWRLIGARP